jgi:hypothetical protein
MLALISPDSTRIQPELNPASGYTSSVHRVDALIRGFHLVNRRAPSFI